MPSQTAVDLSRTRVRAVDIDGTLKVPRVRAFVAADVPPSEPAAGGDPAAPPAHPRYAEGLKELAAQHRLARDPAAVALASADCTFREFELPFTTPDQIDKVIKFEAESHLHLVDIDSVVVDYHLLDRDSRGGSRLLAAACPKETIRAALRDLDSIGIDPHFADLHLTALHTALRTTGYLAPPPPPADAPPAESAAGETILVLECDSDLTHLLVVRGETLLAARTLRLARGGAPGGGEPRREQDEPMVVVDDLGGDDAAAGGRKAAGDWWARLQREVQRTRFKLGSVGDEVSRALLLGTLTLEEGFAPRVERALGMPVEVARPFDRVAHDLDGDALALANAEGAAALGTALRLLGETGGSRIDFRQEDVRYARRFDQVKVALSCFMIVALVCVALLTIERTKIYFSKQNELRWAARAALNEYQQHSESAVLMRSVQDGTETPERAVAKAVDELKRRKNDLASELGRSGTIPRLPSGLDYLNAFVRAIDASIEAIGRIEIQQMDLDIGRDDGRKPQLKLKLVLDGNPQVDALTKALRDSDVVASMQIPTINPRDDGRLEVSNLELDLVPNYDPKRRAAEERE